MRNPHIQKVVLSIALGVHQANHAKRIAEHVTRLLHLPQTPVRTHCKNPVAKWKTRRGTPLGLRITLRKQKALQWLNLLWDRLPHGGMHYDAQSSSMRGGIHTHRLLGLERYDHAAPEYGFNYTVVLGFMGKRVWLRRINPCQKRMPMISKEIGMERIVQEVNQYRAEKKV